MTTLYDIAMNMAFTPIDSPKDYRRSKTISDMVAPASRKVTEGMYTFRPSELAGVLIDPLSINSGEIVGYQREPKRKKIAQIARHLSTGGTVPPISLAINGDGKAATPTCMDGQHRALAAIVAGLPLKVMVEHMTHEEQKARFTNQRLATKVDASLTVLNGSTSGERYVQDAIVNPENPWFGIVGRAGHPLMSPSLMYQVVVSYTRGLSGTITSPSQHLKDHVGAVNDVFDGKRADELARLISAFGTHDTNPPAFRATALKAITGAAIKVLEVEEAERITRIARWHRHMPKFRWDQHVHLTRSREMSLALVNWWNWKLSVANKVPW